MEWFFLIPLLGHQRCYRAYHMQQQLQQQQ
jgi:hypothetical protein